MAFWNKYPYSNLHDLNLDWIIKKIIEHDTEIEKFVSINSLKYGNPIQWDITSQYEKNTIVIDPATGVAYISVQPVPAGVAITNTDYWTVVFDLDRMLNDFRDEIDDFETTINDDVNDFKTQVNGEISTFRTQVTDEINTFKTEVNDDITTFETTINDDVNAFKTEVNGEIDDLTTEFNQFKDATNEALETLLDRYFLFVGDSYGAQNPSFFERAAAFANIDSDHYTNLSVSGTGFSVNGNNGFLAQIQSYSGDKTKITDIIVAGGLNDSSFSGGGSALNSLANAIAQFTSYAENNYPNAKLHLAYIGNAKDSAPLLSGRVYANRQWCCWAYSNYGPSNGMAFINNMQYQLSLSAIMLGTDGIHPSADGADQLGKTLANYIINENVPALYPDYPVSPLTGSGGVTINSTTFHITRETAGETSYLNMAANQTFTLATNQTVSNTERSIATLPTDLYFNERIEIPVNALLINFNSITYQLVPAILAFEGNLMGFRTLQINSAGSGFVTYTATGSSGGSIAITDPITHPFETAIMA